MIMQIVIDIDDSLYDAIQTEFYVNGMRSGKTLLEKLTTTIRNGTPLDDIKEQQYNKGFYDGYKKATTQANAVIDDIKAEILEETECHYGDKCLGANCPSNTDCMIMGEHAIWIIDK